MWRLCLFASLVGAALCANILDFEPGALSSGEEPPPAIDAATMTRLDAMIADLTEMELETSQDDGEGNQLVLWRKTGGNGAIGQHYRFTQSYRGVPVFVSQLLYHVTPVRTHKTGQFIDKIGEDVGDFGNPEDYDCQPVMENLQRLYDRFKYPTQKVSHSNEQCELGIYVSKHTSMAYLAYKVEFFAISQDETIPSEPTQPLFYIGATGEHEGKVFRWYNNLQTGGMRES